MNSRFSRFSILFLFFLLVQTAAMGQLTTGAIQGRVIDFGGTAMSGVNVELESRSSTTFARRSFQTNDKGEFYFAGLEPGFYRAVGKRPDYEEDSREIEVLLGKTTVFDLTMISTVVRPLSVPDFELVPGSTYTTNETRENKNERGVALLPVSPTVSSQLRFAPFVRFEPLAGGIQIDGASGGDNVYFLDGQEVTNYRAGTLSENFNLPNELVQEVAIRSDAIAPESAGSLGGVVSIVTRGGNNEFRGNFEFSIQPSALSGKANPVINRFGTTSGQIEYFTPRKDGGNAFFPGAVVSGPIVKERAWFLAGYTPHIYDTTRTIDYFSSSNPASRTVTETIAYNQIFREEQFFARVDALPHKRVRANVSFFWNPIIENGVLPSASDGFLGVPQSSTTLRGAAFLATLGGRQNSNLVNGQVVFDATDKLQFGVRAGRGFLNEKLDSYGVPKETRFICSTAGTPQNVPGSNCSPGFQNLSTNFVVDRDVSVRTTFDAYGSVIMNAAGRHYLKFGYGANRLFNDIKTGYTDTGIVQLFYGRSIDVISGAPLTPTPGNLGSGFLQRFGTVGTGESLSQSIYLQDSVTIGNRLFITGGVRFENDSFPDYVEGYGVDFGFQDKIAPRIAAMYDVFGDGKTRIFGSFGRFFDRMKFAFSQDQFPIFFYRDYFEILPSRGAAYTNYTLRNILGNNVDDPRGNCPITNSSGWSVCQTYLTIPFGTGPAQYLPPTPIVDPALKPAQSSEFTIGFEQHFDEFYGRDLIFSARYIRRRLDRAVEDISVFTSQGGDNYFLGNPGESLACEISQGTGWPCAPAVRRYDAFEVQASRRSDDYFFNVAYAYSRLRGTYSGLANSDENGRVDPNITRAFDGPAAGFNADGDVLDGALATDRPHVFRAFGGYSFNWFGSQRNRTTVAAFTTIQSGTPLTTVYSLYSNSTSVLFGRGDLGRTERFSQTDLRVGHVFKLDERFVFEPFVTVFNLFSEQNELGRQTSISTTNFTATALTSAGCTSCVSQAATFNTIFNGGIARFVENYVNTRGVSATGIRNDYNLPNLFQAPRSIRFGFRFRF